jgi:hypothetical protein
MRQFLRKYYSLNAIVQNSDCIPSSGRFNAAFQKILTLVFLTHEMKLLSFFFLLLTFQSIKAQDNRTIAITLDKSTAKYFTTDPIILAQVDSAFKMATTVFNSAEFQKEISSMTFNCKSYCAGCSKIDTNSTGRIAGKTVLDTLFKEHNVKMGFELKEKNGPLGLTTPGSSSTTAWYEPIQEDMPAFHSFAYALTVSLCHEYTLRAGFCRLYCIGGWLCNPKKRLNEKNNKPDERFIGQDVTYKVKWAVYYLLMDWKKNGVDPFKGR